MFAESVSLVGASDPALAQLGNTEQATYQAQQLWVRLKKIAQSATISTVNINTLGPGDPVYVEEPVTGLIGKYYIKSGQHKVTAQSNTMNLTLNIEDVLPEAYKTTTEQSSELLGSI
jgi:hypothetical protein